MCRFIAYLGHETMVLDELIEKPEYSLIKQSIGAREGNHIINADGFGIAWYDLKIDNKPGIFKSTQPAWNDSNLRHLITSIKSRCFLSHIRSSTVGDVSLSNCHPFSYNNYSFVHNGTVNKFENIKRALINQLEDDLFLLIKGNTDSECLFLLIMHYLYQNNHDMVLAIKQAIAWIVNAQSHFDDENFAKINIILSNGTEIVAVRFVSKNNESISLNYNISKKDNNTSLIVSSEPLCSTDSQWTQLPQNHCLYFSRNNNSFTIDTM